MTSKADTVVRGRGRHGSRGDQVRYGLILARYRGKPVATLMGDARDRQPADRCPMGNRRDRDERRIRTGRLRTLACPRRAPAPTGGNAMHRAASVIAWLSCSAGMPRCRTLTHARRRCSATVVLCRRQVLDSFSMLTPAWYSATNCSAFSGSSRRCTWRFLAVVDRSRRRDRLGSASAGRFKREAWFELPPLSSTHLESRSDSVASRWSRARTNHCSPSIDVHRSCSRSRSTC